MRVALAVLALTIAASQAQGQRFDDARQLIRASMARDSLPGLAISVSRGDSILWEEGFGWADAEARLPALPTTPFALASLTKAIVATAAMRLSERGRLNLDHAANDYLATKVWSPAWDVSAATVRRLASHTAGLSTFDVWCPDASCRVPSSDEIIRDYAAVVSPPGERIDYSNIGYFVLGEVMARASGRDLAAVLADEVFRPLGMISSSLGVDEARAAQTAVSYGWVRGRVPLETRATRRTPLSGASSGYASAHDLVVFGRTQAKVHQRGSKALLSSAAIDTMQTPAIPGSGSRYAMGWSVEPDRFGYRSLLAQGGTDAAAAWLRIVPSEQIVVAVVANKGVGFPGEVIDAVIGALLPRYAEARKSAPPSAASPTAPVPVRLDSAVTGAWSGTARVGATTSPIEFVVGETGDVRARLGARSDTAIGKARMNGVRLRIAVPGDLNTSDSSRVGQVVFYIRPHAGALVGHVTTGPPPETRLFGSVTWFVEVRRKR